MAWFALLVAILTILSETMSKDCVIDNRTRDYSWQKQMLRDLFTKCNYNRKHPPGNVTNAITNVDIDTFIAIKSFNFDENEEFLSINTWIKFLWTDNRLKWNPDEYDKIKTTQVLFWKIWVPSIKLVNAKEPQDDSEYSFFKCDLYNNGLVSRVMSVTYEVTCSSSLNNWPYDVLNCTFDFGERKTENTKTNFIIDKKHKVVGFSRDVGTHWIIIGKKQRYNLSSEVQLSLTLTLARQAFTLSALIIVPALISAILTLSTLALSSISYTRLGITCFSLLCHFILLQEINEIIPKKITEIPIVLLFVRGSTILTLFCFLFAFMLNHLCKKLTIPHIWIQSLNKFILNSYWRLITLPFWYVDDDFSAKSDGTKSWMIFVNILNNIFAIIVTTTYIIMFSTCLPKPTSKFHFM